jgi:sugar porter (SP) family MFS transporter
VVAALGGLLFGFDTAVISGATHALTELYHLTPGYLGFTVLIALVGTTVGAFGASMPSEIFGRRDSLRGVAIIYMISALGSALAWNWYALLFFRFLGGIAIGSSSVLGPMYIAEIAPARLRGRLVGIFQFNVVLGILLAYFSNYLIGLAGLGANEWRWKLGVCALPSALFFSMLFGIPRSPRWLAEKGRVSEARFVLQRIGELEPETQLREIVASLSFEHSETSEPLFQKRYALPIFLAFSIGMFNQLSGINAILYYLNDIFAHAGFSKISSDLQSVAVGATNLLFTIVGMSIIDKAGRRILLLTGALGTAAALAGVAYIFATQRNQSLLVWLLIGYIAFFALSQGAVIWVYISEVFPTRVRAKGQSLGSFTHWAMNAAISGTFPLVAASSGSAPFVFFSAMMVLQFFVVFFFYPETKGVSLEQMQKKLQVGT